MYLPVPTSFDSTAPSSCNRLTARLAVGSWQNKHLNLLGIPDINTVLVVFGDAKSHDDAAEEEAELEAEDEEGTNKAAKYGERRLAIEVIKDCWRAEKAKKKRKQPVVEIELEEEVEETPRKKKFVRKNLAALSLAICCFYVRSECHIENELLKLDLVQHWEVLQEQARRE